MILLDADPAGALQWATDHAQTAIWLLAIVAGFISWVSKGRRVAKRGQAAVAARRALAPPVAPPVAAAPVSAPVYPSPAYTARIQPAGVASSLDAPVAARSAPARAIGTAFGDPAHARTAVVLAEVLGPPVALR